MDIGTIGVRYARALLKFALERGEEQTVYDEMNVMAQVYSLNPELRRVIENPSLTSEQKEKTLNIAAGSDTCESTKRFIKLVVYKHRADMMQFIANSYLTLYLEHKNIIKSRLVVPTELNQSIIDKTRALIESKTNSKVDFTIETDASIGGGFLLEYGTYRIDATINSQIKKIQQQLTAGCGNS